MSTVTTMATSCSPCLTRCDEMDEEVKRKLIMCTLAGVIFSSGWWIFIDAAAVNIDIMYNNKLYYVPGIFGTLAMIVVNLTPYKPSQDVLYNENKCVPIIRLVILFFALVTSFGTFIWGFYILIADFLIPGESLWLGMEIMLQNGCILLSNLLMKFLRERQIDI